MPVIKSRRHIPVIASAVSFLDYKWDLELDADEIEPSCDDTIRGQLKFWCDVPSVHEKYMQFDELRIELVGRLETRFLLQVGRNMVECGDSHIFYPEAEPDLKNKSSSDSAWTSSVAFQFIRRGVPLSPEFEGKGTGPHAFPFELKLLSPQLWGLKNGCCGLSPTFGADAAQVDYRLEVIGALIQDPFNLQVAHSQSFLVKGGWLNLSLLEKSVNLPGYLTARKKKNKKNGFSLFGSVKGKKSDRMEAKFIVGNKRGFVPGETISSTLEINNKRMESVSNVSVDLVQILYCAGTLIKSTIVFKKEVSNVICHQDFPMEKNGEDEKITCDSSITVPSGLLPTFAMVTKDKPWALQVRYFVEFTINVVDSEPMKGAIAIVIGTTRGDGAGNPVNALTEGKSSNGDDIGFPNQSHYSNDPPSYTSLFPFMRPSLSQESLAPSSDVLWPTFDERYVMYNDGNLNGLSNEGGIMRRRKSTSM